MTSIGLRTPKPGMSLSECGLPSLPRNGLGATAAISQAMTTEFHAKFEPRHLGSYKNWNLQTRSYVLFVQPRYDNFDDPHTQSYAQKFTITDAVLALNGGPTPFAAFSCPKSVVYGAADAQAAAGGYGQIGFRSALI
jgi:hypothetical protein